MTSPKRSKTLSSFETKDRDHEALGLGLSFKSNGLMRSFGQFLRRKVKAESEALIYENIMDRPLTFRVNSGSSLLIEIGVLAASRGHRPYWMVTRNSVIMSILGIIQVSGQLHCQCPIWPYLGTVDLMA